MQRLLQTFLCSLYDFTLISNLFFNYLVATILHKICLDQFTKSSKVGLLMKVQQLISFNLLAPLQEDWNERFFFWNGHWVLGYV